MQTANGKPRLSHHRNGRRRSYNEMQPEQHNPEPEGTTPEDVVLSPFPSFGDLGSLTATSTVAASSCGMVAIPEEVVLVPDSCQEDEPFVAFDGSTPIPSTLSLPSMISPNPFVSATTTTAAARTTTPSARTTATMSRWTVSETLSEESTSNSRKRRRECYHAQLPEERDQEVPHDDPHSLDLPAFPKITSRLCSLRKVSETSAATPTTISTTLCPTMPGLPGDPSSLAPMPTVGSKKQRSHPENTNTSSSNGTAKADTNDDTAQSSIALSISKAVRRRLHYMTRGTSLVPRTLPPILTTSNGVVDSNHPLQQHRQQTLFLRSHALLGKGAFAVVRSVTVETTALPATPSSTANEGDNSCNDNKKLGYYACKSIKKQLFALATRAAAADDSNDSATTATETDRNKKHRRAYIQAESQLAYEAHILGSLNHPNIIKLVGFFSSPSENNSNDSCRFDAMEPVSTELDDQGRLSTRMLPLEGPKRSLLLTEILDETLAQKLSRWRTAPTAIDTTSHRRGSATLEKLTICQQLAEALEHLHSHSIAYRDLKPENIGFLGSTLKLFDFGLSREMLPSSSLLKGVIGTMRYMAPEVCLEESYDLECDLYSYSVVCWEIWTHRTPYANLTPHSYKKLVCLDGLRPPDIDHAEDDAPHHNHNLEIPPKPVLALLEKGWVHDPKSRIRWKSIRAQLLRILLQRRG